MLVTLCKSKIHRVTVTEANLNYEGSITLDMKLMDAAEIFRYERVQIVNINNGNRLETYVIAGEPGSGTVCLNGAAARMAHAGDLIIVISYAEMESEVARSWKPILVYVDDNNQIVRTARG